MEGVGSGQLLVNPTRWGEALLEGVGYGPQFSNPVRVSPHFSSSRGIYFVQTPPPPREVLSISWDLQTKVINKNNFSTVF